MSDELEEIKSLSRFRIFACSECDEPIEVHALEIYAKCPNCGTKHKCRAFGGIGAEIHDHIDAALEWAGISQEELKERHQRERDAASD